VLIDSEARQPQAQRTADKPWRQQRDQARKACHPLGHSTFACEADALQALSACEQGWQVTPCAQVTIRPIARDGKRGRPGRGAQPAQVGYQVAGARASSLAARPARITQQRCCLLATNALDDQPWPPQALLDGDKGQSQAERGCRFWKDPQCLASALSRNKPERLMALLMIMTVCWLVYAALEYRIRTALRDHGATLPDQKGHPVQNPTARWIFPYVVGIHRLSVAGQWPLVFNLTEEPGNLLKRLGQPYMQLYGVKYS
jgi:transposase